MQVGKFPPISSSNPIGSPQLRLESKRQGAVNDGPINPAGTAFADLTIESHRETWPIRSKRFRSWLRRCYYQAFLKLSLAG
jgi:hypothetical protein